MVRSFGLSGFRFYSPARYLVSALFGDDLLLGLTVVSSFSWLSKTILSNLFVSFTKFTCSKAKSFTSLQVYAILRLA